MNFDNLKQKMDAENMDNTQIPTNIKDLKTSNMPIEKVRKTMRGEIITQLISIVFFFAVPSFIKIYDLPKAIYYILMFFTCVMTLGYLAKMTWFLTKTRNLNANSKDTIVAFIHDLKLTLEVYKTAIIAGSLLLPLSMLALVLGTKFTNEEIFTKIILLNMPPLQLILFIVGYLAIAILFYYITVIWADRLYGVHIKQLEKTLQDFEVEN